ncbi:MAG: efflux RND transporter periplasmic adaptor subunit [Bacteroidales bacterium]|nr:efflux RND transporter periplasmic adaptor subunit [Bacteroidales bacterium]
MRKYVTIIIGIILVAASAYIAKDLSNRKKDKQPANEKVAPTVFIETVHNTSIPVQVIESGRLQAKNKIEIFAEVQGVMEVSKKDFKPGTKYGKGENIVSIRNADYAANLQAQKSNFQNLISSIMPDLRLDYPEAFKQWDEYLRNFDMNKPIGKLPEPINDKEKYFLTGNNIYTSYYNTKNMEIVLAKYHLKAPFSGILTDALVTPGTLVRPGQKLGEFIDPSVYELEVAVNKSVLSSLKIGEQVKVRDTENHSNQWNGKVVRINGKVDRTTQTVKIYIELKGTELKDGMYLEAVIDGKPIDSSMEIARSLLIDESKVYIVQDSSLQLVDVDPVFFNQKTVVVKGLSDGQQLISRIVAGAYSGMAVKIFKGEK